MKSTPTTPRPTLLQTPAPTPKLTMGEHRQQSWWATHERPPTPSPTHPTMMPTVLKLSHDHRPTFDPTYAPTARPTWMTPAPTHAPTAAPSHWGWWSPVATPTSHPTLHHLTAVPTLSPRAVPPTPPPMTTLSPTATPTILPTAQTPTMEPTLAPTPSPTLHPTIDPLYRYVFESQSMLIDTSPSITLSGLKHLQRCTAREGEVNVCEPEKQQAHPREFAYLPCHIDSVRPHVQRE